MANSKFSDYRRFPLAVPHAGSVGDPLSLGYVYVFGFCEPGVVKIGSAAAPSARLTDLQCGNPFELRVEALVSIYQGSPVLIERATHRLAKEAHIRGEWFQLEVDEAVALIIKAARDKKAKFGAYAVAYETVVANHKPQEAFEAQEAERRRVMRRKLGIEEDA